MSCLLITHSLYKGAEVIRNMLEQKETARLWCLLGDATDDIAHYQRALDLSKGKSARAHRSLGYHHYVHKEHKEAVGFYQASLERCSYQPLTLLRLSYCAMELEDWSLAASSYRSYTAMEPDNFEAWNNLARYKLQLLLDKRYKSVALVQSEYSTAPLTML